MFFIWITEIILAFSFLSLSIAEEHDHHKHHDALTSAAIIPGTSIRHLDSTWKNQHGKSVEISGLSEKPRLVVMLFTQCQTACPVIIEELKEISSALTPAQRKDLDVSIFSLDSKRDTPKNLLKFSKKRKLPENWELYTGDSNAISELAAVLGVRYKKLDNGDFLHSNTIYLLDKQGVIIAKKDGLKTPNKEFLKQIQSAKILP